MAVSGNFGFNFGAIGNVGMYARQLVNSYSARAKASVAGGNADDTIKSTVASNAKFAATNTSNLKSLKTTASSLERAARNVSANGGADDLVKAAEGFASAYNRTMGHLVSGAATGAGVSRAISLVGDNGMTAGSIANRGTYASARMAGMGITIDEDGNMQVDAEKLKQAAADSPASVKSMLTGYGSIAETTMQNADKAMRIPAATYTDFSQMQVSNSLLDALLPKTGALFDFFA
ncbi:MAG: flagellar filament capping protein FliD [Clostridia bacterium]|nr:flagellar filament capping protein FliD [Clostridia bacterium]